MTFNFARIAKRLLFALIFLMFFYFLLGPNSYIRRGTPPAGLETPGVLAGEEHMLKEQFTQFSIMSPAYILRPTSLWVYLLTPKLITDIQIGDFDVPAGDELVLVGNFGAAFLDENLDRYRVLQFKEYSLGVNKFVPELGRHGEHGFLQSGLVSGPTRLLDSAGNPIWEYEVKDQFVRDVSMGDVDGDGGLDTAIGFLSDGGVHLLDETGKSVWKKEGDYVFQMAMVDVDGDGSAEILYSNGSGNLLFRGASGELVMQRETGENFFDFDLLALGRDTAPRHLMALVEDALLLMDFNGVTLKRFPAPFAGDNADVKTVRIQISENEFQYVTLLDYFGNRRAMLLVHNVDGQLLYQEILDSNCGALATYPRSKGQSLLVGCEGLVWEYKVRISPDGKN